MIFKNYNGITLFYFFKSWLAVLPKLYLLLTGYSITEAFYLRPFDLKKKKQNDLCAEFGLSKLCLIYFSKQVKFFLCRKSKGLGR